MNKRFTVLFALTALFAVTAMGQPASVFKVFANKGAVELKSGETRQPLKTGAALKSEDQIIVCEGCYVALVHSTTGKPQQLTSAGTYAVKDLASKVTGNSGVVSKYTEFILSSNSDEAKRNRLSATGAVHRGLNDIDVFLPDPRSHGNHVMGDSVVVAWESKTSKQGPYEIELKNMFGDALQKVQTSESKVKIALPAKVDIVTLEVRRKGESASNIPQFSIQRFNPEKDKATIQKIKAELAELNLSEETAINKFILAGFYEYQNLLIDAISAYEHAIRLAPDVDTYKEAYNEFLLRKQLKDAKPQ